MPSSDDFTRSGASWGTGPLGAWTTTRFGGGATTTMTTDGALARAAYDAGNSLVATLPVTLALPFECTWLLDTRSAAGESVQFFVGDSNGVLWGAAAVTFGGGNVSVEAKLRDAGGLVTPGSVIVAADTAQAIYVRLRVESTGVKVNAWPAVASEPAGWLSQATAGVSLAAIAGVSVMDVEIGLGTVGRFLTFDQFVITAGGLGLGSAPRGLSGAPEYVIEIYDSGATFGPNTKLAEVWDARNVGWSRYDRLPGKAFFTLSQSSAVLPLLVPLTTHIAIWRITPSGDTLVYRGVYVDSNNTGDDVILDCFDYKSLLSISRAGFKTLYPTKKLGTEIVSPEWVLAKGATSSPLGFVTTGTIEDPLALDAVTLIKTNAQFGTLDQTRLQLFYDLTEMGRANTVNQVTFDIDLTNTFHFYKNRGVASALALVLGGNVSDYGYLPGWARYRNDVATVGVAGAGGSTEIVATNAGEIAAKGRRQDVTTLKTLAGIGGGATETDQQKAALERDLKRLVQQQSALMLRVERGKVEPFVGYELNDTARIEIGNGIDTITGVRRIIGVRCLFAEAGEDIDILVAQVAT